MNKSFESVIRLRMSSHDAHYGGNLVDGALILKLFGDAVTELLIRHDGDEGLSRVMKSQRTYTSSCALSLALLGLLAASMAVAAPRARDIGIPLDGKPGALNAITDVAGVEVGQVTLISGEGALKRGEGPVRTGVTAIIPRGKNSTNPVFAGWATSNAAGEMTGTTWLEERGYFDGPIMLRSSSKPFEIASSAFHTAKFVVGVVPPICGLSQ